jgi:hypothetical protein
MCCLTVFLGRCYVCKGPVSLRGCTDGLITVTVPCAGSRSPLDTDCDWSGNCKGTVIVRNVACRGVGDQLCRECCDQSDGSRGLFPELYWGTMRAKRSRS